jgi:hypothetical protein
VDGLSFGGPGSDFNATRHSRAEPREGR